MMKIENIADFKACLTCVHRKPYPASMKTGKPVFYRFQCGLSIDSGRTLVRPEDVCKHWKGAAVGVE